MIGQISAQIGYFNSLLDGTAAAGDYVALKYGQQHDKKTPLIWIVAFARYAETGHPDIVFDGRKPDGPLANRKLFEWQFHQ